MKRQLNDRERRILCEVVARYLVHGEPVASGTLARSAGLGLSSASIRSVLAELEEAGLLLQPHTSAGRIPSDLGVRLYIEELIDKVALAPADAEALRSRLRRLGPLEESLAEITRVLADLSAEVGIVAAPSSGTATIESLHFFRVGAQRVMGLVVTAGGLVESRLLSVDRDYSPAELERITNFCNQHFTGLSLREIRERILHLMAEERALADSLVAGVIALARPAVGGDEAGRGEVFLEGADHLIERAAPRELEAVRRLYSAFTDKALLLRLLDGYVAASGPCVVIGSEFTLVGGDGLSFVARPFLRPGGERGLIGVIGLKRMDYQRIIPLVDCVGTYLDDIGAVPGGLA